MATIVFGIGYIGSALVQELLFQGREVIGFDNFFSTDQRAIDGFRQSPGFSFVEGSITDPTAVERALASADEAVDAVFILAAQSSAHSEAATAEYTEETNLRGPRVILDCLDRRRGRSPVVFASSMRVYGSPLPETVSECSSLGSFRDLSHLSKCYVEKLLEMYSETRGLLARSVRLGLTFGVAPVMKTDSRFMTAPNLFCFQVAAGHPITIRSRDPLAIIHVDDAIDALLLAASGDSEANYAVYNACGEVATIPEIGAKLVQIASERDLDAVVDAAPEAVGQQPVRPVVTSRLTTRGFAPRRTLRDGLTATLDHFLVRGK